MSRSHKKKFAEICEKDSTPGYVLDKYQLIKQYSIAEAEEIVSKHINHCMKELSRGWGRSIKKFYIGKSHIRKRKHVNFSPSNPATWRLEDGVNHRYSDHVTHDYGRNGLIVVAVVTKESIPQSNIRDRSITHQEEYALILEKRLIQRFKGKNGKLTNRTQEPGKTDKESSIAYAVYMAFTIDSDPGEEECSDTSSNNSFNSDRLDTLPLSSSQPPISHKGSEDENNLISPNKLHNLPFHDVIVINDDTDTLGSNDEGEYSSPFTPSPPPQATVVEDSKCLTEHLAQNIDVIINSDHYESVHPTKNKEPSRTPTPTEFDTDSMDSEDEKFPVIFSPPVPPDVIIINDDEGDVIIISDDEEDGYENTNSSTSSSFQEPEAARGESIPAPPAEYSSARSVEKCGDSDSRYSATSSHSSPLDTHRKRQHSYSTHTNMEQTKKRHT